MRLIRLSGAIEMKNKDALYTGAELYMDKEDIPKLLCALKDNYAIALRPIKETMVVNIYRLPSENKINLADWKARKKTFRVIDGEQKVNEPT